MAPCPVHPPLHPQVPLPPLPLSKQWRLLLLYSVCLELGSPSSPDSRPSLGDHVWGRLRGGLLGGWSGWATFSSREVGQATRLEQEMNMQGQRLKLSWKWILMG